MNKISTLSTSELASLVKMAICQHPTFNPKPTTLLTIRKIARNYRADASLPDGLQGYMLS